ncbi:MAG: hypothetical protein H6825_06230 [Planctomycetes bacterium]|nr:hypothetical protein [Planctomycetota bacterium]
MTGGEGFTPDERALLEETAAALVRRRMAVPAMMALEVMAPMNFVSASMLHVLTPMLSIVLPSARIRQVATLLERRSALPELVRAIDAAEDARRRDERTGRPPRRGPPWRRRDATRAEPTPARTPPRGETSDPPDGSEA